MVYKNIFLEKETKKINFKRKAELKLDKCLDYVMGQKPDLDIEKLVKIIECGLRDGYKYRKLWNALRNNWACPDSFLCSCKDGPWEQCPHKHVSKRGHENYEEKCWHKISKELEEK